MAIFTDPQRYAPARNAKRVIGEQIIAFSTLPVLCYSLFLGAENTWPPEAGWPYIIPLTGYIVTIYIHVISVRYIAMAFR